SVPVARGRPRRPKTSDGFSRCPPDAGATAAHGAPVRPNRPDCSLPSLRTRSMAVLPRFLVAGLQARPILVPRIRSGWLVSEPRSEGRVLDTLGRVLDQSQSVGGFRTVPRRAALGNRRHAAVPVPRRSRGVSRLRPWSPHRAITG